MDISIFNCGYRVVTPFNFKPHDKICNFEI